MMLAESYNSGILHIHVALILNLRRYCRRRAGLFAGEADDADWEATVDHSSLIGEVWAILIFSSDAQSDCLRGCRYRAW